jgi:hypothetical protein
MMARMVKKMRVLNVDKMPHAAGAAGDNVRTFTHLLRFMLPPLLHPPQPYRQQHRYRQNQAKVEFAAHFKHVGADDQESNEPDEFSQNVQLEKVAEDKTHEEGVDAEGDKL